MSGGLMQLVAVGAQDIYLTGAPQITFFKVVYRRHTNFAMESIVQTFNGVATFGQRSTVIVSRNGDLIHSAYLYAVLPSLSMDMVRVDSVIPSPGPSPSPGPGPVPTGLQLCWCNFIGLALIEQVAIEIGGQEIDRHYNTYMYVWKELTMSSEKAEGYSRMVGGNPNTGFLIRDNALAPQELHVPLDFWFNINPGLALPLIALQYHEVRFVFNFTNVSKLLVVVDEDGTILPRESWQLVNPAQITGAVSLELYIDYIYLDTEERRRFAQMSHEYLIEQVQQTTSNVSIVPGDKNLRLSFNHPCSELIWFFQREDNDRNNDHFNFSNSTPGNEKLGTDLLTNAVLTLNGHNRFQPRRGPLYFRQWQPFCHHTNIPLSNIYVYSFALRPEEHQPSGTCNFSRIDNTHLTFNLDNSAEVVSPANSEIVFPKAENCTITVYARNYNVLRIMSGMGGLAYSN